MNGVNFQKKYMNGVNFRYGKYMNGSCFSLGLVYEWGGVRGLQPHIRTQNHGKLPPPPVRNSVRETPFVINNNTQVTVRVFAWHSSVTKRASKLIGEPVTCGSETEYTRFVSIKAGPL